MSTPPTPTPRAAHCRLSFTLIELLVVVAIITVLAAMLMPALARGREMARRTVCMGNLRQIGIAVMAYGPDFGEYPQGVQSGNQATPSVVRDWVGNGLGLYGAKPTANGIWVCPTTPRFLFDTGAANFRYPNYVTSYIYTAEGDKKHVDDDPTASWGGTGWVSTVGGYPNHASYVRDASPSTTVIAGDAITWHGAFYQPHGTPHAGTLYSVNHGNDRAGRIEAQNIIHGDGHAARQALGQGLPSALNRSTSGGNWRYNAYTGGIANAEVLLWW